MKIHGYEGHNKGKWDAIHLMRGLVGDFVDFVDNIFIRNNDAI